MLTRILLAIAVLAVVAITAACAAPLLSAVSASATTLTPNGDGRTDGLTINYTIGQESQISITLTGPDGRQYVLRENERRSPGPYAFRFDGTYIPDRARLDRRVLPNGAYTWTVRASGPGGSTAEGSGQFTISDADTNFPRVTNLLAEPNRISPNGDAQNDEMIISFGVSKDSQVEIYVTDTAGERFVLEPPTEKKGGLYSHRWNGQVNGRLLPDGEYRVHVQAKDAAGNLTDASTTGILDQGGVARLIITSARFAPISVPRGGFLNVEIVVRNVGEVPLATLGPPPGTPYTTQMNFNSFRDVPDPNAPPQFFERAGVWRVGVDWENSGRPYPIRWALLPNLNQRLMPGEEAVITGTIQVLIDQTPSVVFWASVVQEGVGFPGGRVGLTRITISF